MSTIIDTRASSDILGIMLYECFFHHFPHFTIVRTIDSFYMSVLVKFKIHIKRRGNFCVELGYAWGVSISIRSSATFYWGYATQAAHRALTPYSGLLSERSVRTKMERKVQNSRRKSSTYDIVWYIQMLFYTSSTHNCTCRSKELFSGQTRFSEKLLAVTFAPWIPIEVKHRLSVLQVPQLRPKLVMSLLGTVPFWVAITVIHHGIRTGCWGWAMLKGAVILVSSIAHCFCRRPVLQDSLNICHFRRVIDRNNHDFKFLCTLCPYNIHLQRVSASRFWKSNSTQQTLTSWMSTADRREIRFHHPHRFLKLWISRPVPSSLMGMSRAKKQDRRLKHSQTHSSWPFLIASSHRFLIFDGLASDFSEKKNFSNERVVVCRADSVELYHFCQELHKTSFWSVNSPC